MTVAKKSDSRLLQLLLKPAAWFCLALLLRMLYMLDQAGTSPLFYVPLLDEKEAIDSARQLLNGQVEAEPYFKAPGYSWFLALVLAVSGDAWPWTVRIIQHVAGASLAFFAAKLAAGITPAGRRRSLALCTAGFFAATYAPLIRLEENISLDFWVVFLQSLMVYYLARIPRARNISKTVAAAGLLAAAAWLTRPTLTAILPFLGAWIFFIVHRAPRSVPLARATGAAALFLVPVLLAAGAVGLRNYTVSGQFLILPWQGGFSLYYANKEGVSGRYFLQDKVSNTSEANPTYHLALEGYYSSIGTSNIPPIPEIDFVAVDRYWKNRTVTEIGEQPLPWLRLMMQKLIYLGSDKEIFNYEDFDLQRSRSFLLSAYPTTFGVVFGLALGSIAYIGCLSRRRREVVGLLWLYIVSLGGAIALYYVSGRMRMPLAFPIIVLAGHCLGMVLTPGGSRRSLAVMFLLLGLVISFGDWWGVRSESMAHADLARMSNAAWHRDRYDDALKLALEAEAIDPSYPVIPRLKGQAYYYLGELEQARIEFQKSVRLLGDDTSRRNLEIIHTELERRKTGE